jgi:hypothetical protein
VGPIPETRFVAAEANATKRPSNAIEDSPLGPFETLMPSGVEIKVVAGVQPLAAFTHVERS